MEANDKATALTAVSGYAFPQGQTLGISPLEALKFAAIEDSEQAVSSRRLLNDLHSYPDQDTRYDQQMEHSYCGDGPAPARMVVGELDALSWSDCSCCQHPWHVLSDLATAAAAASHFDLKFLDKMGLDYVAYQHHDPAAPYWCASDRLLAACQLQSGKGQ